MRFLGSRFIESSALWFSRTCVAVFAAAILWVGHSWYEYKKHETNCLTSVVQHEVGGEKLEVRNIVARVVLAAVADTSFTKARSVCAFARIKGMFSNLHAERIAENRFEVPGWNKIHDEVLQVYNRPRTLPNGWGCVRAFRDSDDYLESISSKALKQLGITRTAKGLRYHAAAFVPVDTRGHITFYSPRGGCKNPTPTDL